MPLIRASRCNQLLVVGRLDEFPVMFGLNDESGGGFVDMFNHGGDGNAVVDGAVVMDKEGMTMFFFDS